MVAKSTSSLQFGRVLPTYPDTARVDTAVAQINLLFEALQAAQGKEKRVALSKPALEKLHADITAALDKPNRRDQVLSLCATKFVPIEIAASLTGVSTEIADFVVAKEILSLHKQGVSVARIAEMTGYSGEQVEAKIATHAAGGGPEWIYAADLPDRAAVSGGVDTCGKVGGGKALPHCGFGGSPTHGTQSEFGWNGPMGRLADMVGLGWVLSDPSVHYAAVLTGALMVVGTDNPLVAVPSALAAVWGGVRIVKGLWGS